MARRIQCPVWDAGTVPVFCMMAVPLFLPMLSQVALPLPKPNAPLEKGKDQYKIQLSFDGEFPSSPTISWGWLGAFLLLSRLRFVLPLIIVFSRTVR